MSNVENAADKIVIEEMVVHMRKIYVSDSVKETLASELIIFLIDRIVQKQFSVPQGGNKFNGQISRRLVFGFFDNSAHVGSYTGNPFNWEHANIQKVSLFLDVQMINARPLSVDFGRGSVMDGYWSLARATNTRYANSGTLITLDDYKKVDTHYGHMICVPLNVMNSLMTQNKEEV